MRPEQWPPFSDAQRKEIDRGLLFSKIGAPLARIGIVRLTMTSLLCGSGRIPRAIGRITGPEGRFLFGRITCEVAKMPPECRPVIVATWSSPNFYRGLAAYLNAISASTVEMHQVAPIEDIPVVILTAANASPLDDEALARIGSNARQVHPKDSTHWIHLDQPHHVLNAIQALLEEIRSTQVPPPLKPYG
jgi:pimeloyl-ACP methyl ester carboxylesterase